MSFYYSLDSDRHQKRMRYFAPFPVTRDEACLRATAVAQAIVERTAPREDAPNIFVRFYPDDKPETYATWEVVVRVGWLPTLLPTATSLRSLRASDKPGQTYMSFLEEEAQ